MAMIANAQCEDDARLRLTVREDKRRPLQPWHADTAAGRLTLSGELATDLSFARREALGTGEPPVKHWQWNQEADFEAFLMINPNLSVFAQVRGAQELRRSAISAGTRGMRFLERGEFWVRAETESLPRWSFEVGRLHFEDERRWWWDAELDGLRLAWEGEHADLSVALAQEILPARSNESHVAASQEGILRILLEGAWNPFKEQTFEFFALHHSDRSAAQREGLVLANRRADPSDARLTWAGARWMGAQHFGHEGLMGYWLDGAYLTGNDTRGVYEPHAPGESEVTSVRRRSVRGWSFDAGAHLLLPLALEPRLFAGHAKGSGGSSNGPRDHAFRQSGLAPNESGFGGVQRFPHYGLALNPELSNISITTLGVGITVAESSSLDLVYHHYRMVNTSGELCASGLDLTLDGVHRNLGWGLDLVLALEERERLEFEFTAAYFQADKTLGTDANRSSVSAMGAVRWAF